MEQIYKAVCGNPLFAGIDAHEFSALLRCAQARVQRYAQGETALLAGSPVNEVGIVVQGRVHVVREDREGRQNLMAELRAGGLFAETLACAGVTQSPVTVLCAEACEILFLNYRRVISTCTSACSFHSRLVENMLALLAQKNLHLNDKIEILSRRTIRQRVLLYFDQVRHGERHFTLAYSREELAAYLCVDRSALSAELSAMQREGLIAFSHNHFTIL